MESTLTGCKRFEGVKTILLSTKPDEVFQPQQLERTLLLVLLPLFAFASVAAATVDILMGTATWFERYQLIPMAFVFMGIWWWCANTRSNQVARIRLATLIVGPGIIMERFLLGLSMTYRDGYSPNHFNSITVWVILASCMYVLLLPGRHAFLAGFAYYLVTVFFIALFAVFNPHPLPESVWQEMMIAHIVATPIFLVIIGGFSRLRTAYGSALTRAEASEHLAMQDGLTGLFNRRAFASSMRRARSRQARRQTPVSMVMLDLDHFKRINDTYGHETGDTVLVKISKILTDTMRRTDDIIRWGGEEFMILMEETSADKAGLVADRLREIIETTQILKKGRVTASFGITELIPGETDTDFFNRADAALYDAKDMGRNRVVVRKRSRRPSDPKVKRICDIIDSSRFGSE
ncbi:MAG: GGDEF domain-containing protein [Planctomycetes bacterium]|nr:GGDEF domain-containing protein [Planctomycetota bacterium]